VLIRCQTQHLLWLLLSKGARSAGETRAPSMSGKKAFEVVAPAAIAAASMAASSLRSSTSSCEAPPSQPTATSQSQSGSWVLWTQEQRAPSSASSHSSLSLHPWDSSTGKQSPRVAARSSNSTSAATAAAADASNTGALAHSGGGRASFTECIELALREVSCRLMLC
jgi:hypothetical protein